MFCPVCSQEQISEEIRFCSRCGFPLTGVSELIARGGNLPQTLTENYPTAISPRKKGIKRGATLLFISFILVPLLAIITIAVRAEPFLVAAAAVLFGGGGILRIFYALLFESGLPIAQDDGVLPESVKNYLPGKLKKNALPPKKQAGIPASAYVPPVAASAGNWRDTNEFVAPPSVTDPTTKLLEKEKEN